VQIIQVGKSPVSSDAYFPEWKVKVKPSNLFICLTTPGWLPSAALKQWTIWIIDKIFIW
jgi:hypothetical protein